MNCFNQNLTKESDIHKRNETKRRHNSWKQNWITRALTNSLLCSVFYFVFLLYFIALLYCESSQSQSQSHGHPQKFFQGGGEVDLLLILFRLLAMQCNLTFTKGFILYTSQKNARRYSNSPKKCTSLVAMLVFHSCFFWHRLLQCFVTLFGFVHRCHRLLHSHSPYCWCMADMTINHTVELLCNVNSRDRWKTSW